MADDWKPKVGEKVWIVGEEDDEVSLITWKDGDEKRWAKSVFRTKFDAECEKADKFPPGPRELGPYSD